MGDVYLTLRPLQMVAAFPFDVVESDVAEGPQCRRRGAGRAQERVSRKDFLLERFVKPAGPGAEGAPGAPHRRVEVELGSRDLRGEARFGATPERVHPRLRRRR